LLLLTVACLDGILISQAALCEIAVTILYAFGLPKLNLFFAWQKDLASAGWTTVMSTILDILLVAAAVYWLIMLCKRTRAWLIFWGIVIVLALVRVTDLLQLHTINYLLGSFIPLLPVAIVILFYPELRHTLENMGRVADWGVNPFSSTGHMLDVGEANRRIDSARTREQTR
jgi:hypothetical protein